MERNGEKVDNVKQNEVSDYEDFEFGYIVVFYFMFKKGCFLRILVIVVGCDVFCNLVVNIIIFKGYVYIYVMFDLVDFKFDVQDCSVEGEEEDVIEQENLCGEEVELLEVVLDIRECIENKNDDFYSVVLQNFEIFVFDSCLNSILDDVLIGWFG